MSTKRVTEAVADTAVSGRRQSGVHPIVTRRLSDVGEGEIDVAREDQGTRDSDAECTRMREEDLIEKLERVEAEKAAVERCFEQERQARVAAEQVTQQTQRLLMEVSHDARASLTSLAGWLRKLGTDGGDAGTHRRALMSMTRGVHGLARVVSELMSHACFEPSEPRIRTRDLDLVRVVVEVIEDLRPLAEAKQIGIALTAHTHVLPVHGDPWRLQQAFRNLVLNAIRFTPEGGSVRLWLAIEGERAEVVVRDTGVGLSPGALSALRDPAPDATPSPGGLGIGITRRWVELHGGTLTADSEGPDRGSTFRVRLPMRDSIN